jgi:hypothetical protein
MNYQKYNTIKQPLIIVILIFEMLVPALAQDCPSIKNPYNQKDFSIGLHNHIIGLDEMRKDYIGSTIFSKRIGKYYRIEPEVGYYFWRKNEFKTNGYLLGLSFNRLIINKQKFILEGGPIFQYSHVSSNYGYYVDYELIENQTVNKYCGGIQINAEYFIFKSFSIGILTDGLYNFTLYKTWYTAEAIAWFGQKDNLKKFVDNSISAHTGFILRFYF